MPIGGRGFPNIFISDYISALCVKYSETAGTQAPEKKKQDDLRQGRTLSGCLSSVWLCECSFPVWAHKHLTKVCVNMTVLQILPALPSQTDSASLVWCERKGKVSRKIQQLVQSPLRLKTEIWIKTVFTRVLVSHYSKHLGRPAAVSEARPACRVFPGLLQIPFQYHKESDSSLEEQSNK